MTQHLLNETSITTASDKVFVDMRREIVEGSIAQGSKISEPELAKRYGVSRATLREALNRLESCYLVERKANIGCRVVALTAERLIENKIIICRNESTINDGCILFFFGENMHKLLKGSN